VSPINVVQSVCETSEHNESRRNEQKREEDDSLKVQCKSQRNVTSRTSGKGSESETTVKATRSNEGETNSDRLINYEHRQNQTERDRQTIKLVRCLPTCNGSHGQIEEGGPIGVIFGERAHALHAQHALRTCRSSCRKRGQLFVQVRVAEALLTSENVSRCPGSRAG
jgi:hypothetical protein